VIRGEQLGGARLPKDLTALPKPPLYTWVKRVATPCDAPSRGRALDPRLGQSHGTRALSGLTRSTTSILGSGPSGASPHQIERRQTSDLSHVIFESIRVHSRFRILNRSVSTPKNSSKFRLKPKGFSFISLSQRNQTKVRRQLDAPRLRTAHWSSGGSVDHLTPPGRCSFTAH
jgi:hypothetical protein